MSPRLQDSCSLTCVLYDMPEDRSSVGYTSGSNRERSSSYMSHLRWPPVGDGCGAGAARSLVGGVRWRESAAPVVTKGAQVSILGDRIGEGLAGGARGGSGAAGAGESESPPGGSKCAPSERESRVWWLKAEAMVRSSEFAMSPRLQDSCSLTCVLYDMPEDRSSIRYTPGSNRERSSSYMSHLRLPPVGDGCGAPELLEVL